MEALVYIVEDDEGIRELYDGAFEGLFVTKMFENGNDFFESFAVARPNLVILDIMLPDIDGY
ncbi:MAG: response regulator, partial [Clostridiales bacterium]|nr:response regulator [Clostridiales bacterium]